MNSISSEGPRADVAHDLAEAIAVRQSGGAAAPEVLARNFLEQIQGEIDRQVDERVQQQLQSYQPARGPVADKEMVLGMALGSLGIAIPLSAVAGWFGGFPGLIVAWACIVLINVAWSVRRTG